jgi:hypothetical protein
MQVVADIDELKHAHTMFGGRLLELRMHPALVSQE